MLLNEKDKETLVTDLLNKGLTARDIAREAHVSFTDIKRIRAKLTGDSDDTQYRKKESPSIPSQAFKLFLEGKSLVDVAIAFDIQTEQVLRVYKDYLTLQRTSKFVSILDRHRDSIPTFLEWFQHIERRNVKPEDFTVALECAKDLKSLQQKKEEP